MNSYEYGYKRNGVWKLSLSFTTLPSFLKAGLFSSKQKLRIQMEDLISYGIIDKQKLARMIIQ